MLDHVIITVKDLDRSIAFYETALKPLGIVHAVDYNGKDGPDGHPDLKGFGRDGRVFFWLRQGNPDARTAHIGFVAKGEIQVNGFYDAAMGAGAADNGKPGHACITILAITPQTFSIPTAIASRQSTRVGSTRRHNTFEFSVSASDSLLSDFIDPFSHGLAVATGPRDDDGYSKHS